MELNTTEFCNDRASFDPSTRGLILKSLQDSVDGQYTKEVPPYKIQQNFKKSKPRDLFINFFV
ncbi:hypothetical protein CVS40_2732 [Lucilia cuprina]|nr:hypothetical protein CVS40_2732 [Lucilia cuprina]